MRQAWGGGVSWCSASGDGGTYEFRLVDHRSENEFGAAQTLVEGSAVEFCRLGSI